MLPQVRLKKSIGSHLWSRAYSRGLGIDIGQTQTKVVSVECHRGEPCQICATTIPTILESDGENEVNSTPRWSSFELKNLARRIRQLLGGRYRASGARIALTLSMSVCDYRTIYLPSESRVRSTTLQETIAAATDDQRPRCIALLPGGASASDEAKSMIRCFSLPEELSWSAAQAFDEVGLTPHAINGLPWCLANAVELIAGEHSAGAIELPAGAIELPAGAIELVVDWSYGSPTLVAVRNGNIDYVRCLSHGSLEELASQARADYHMTFAEAQHWIAACLVDPPQEESLNNTTETSDWIDDCCRHLAEEIHTAVEYLRWRHQSAPPPILRMTGGGTLIPGLQAILQSHLNHEINPWNWSDGTSTLTADYATAASLAFQEIRRAQR